MNWIGKIGQGILTFFTFNIRLYGLVITTLKQCKHLIDPKKRKIFNYLFMRQLYNTGVRAAYVNTVIAVLVGWGLMSQAYVLLPPSTGLTEQYAQFFVIVVIRELGPMISGIILIARSAAAITSEIGYLRLSNEFENLDAMRMDPVFVLLLPVFFAFPVSLFFMFFYFDVVCIVASYLVLTLIYDLRLDFTLFISSIVSQISMKEVVLSVAKAFLGGSLIGLISILYGASVGGRFTDISRAISNSTTTQLLGFFVLNIFLSILAYR